MRGEVAGISGSYCMGQPNESRSPAWRSSFSFMLDCSSRCRRRRRATIARRQQKSTTAATARRATTAIAAIAPVEIALCFDELIGDDRLPLLDPVSSAEPDAELPEPAILASGLLSEDWIGTLVVSAESPSSPVWGRTTGTVPVKSIPDESLSPEGEADCEPSAAPLGSLPEAGCELGAPPFAGSDVAVGADSSDPSPGTLEGVGAGSPPALPVAVEV